MSFFVLLSWPCFWQHLEIYFFIDIKFLCQQPFSRLVSFKIKSFIIIIILWFALPFIIHEICCVLFYLLYDFVTLVPKIIAGNCYSSNIVCIGRVSSVACNCWWGIWKPCEHWSCKLICVAWLNLFYIISSHASEQKK